MLASLPLLLAISGIARPAPENHLVEVGPYWGAFLPSGRHELYEPSATLPDQGYRDYKPAMFDFGVRAGYYPLRFLGIEAEGGAMPGRTVDRNSATVWTFRGHIVGQIGLWRVVPFLLGGVGIIGVRSARTALGDDDDIGVHVGIGMKVYINRWLAARLDARNVVTARQGFESGITSNGEVLLGLSFTLGRKKLERREPEPIERRPDRDGDGLDDVTDVCPDAAASTADGCPVADTDADGIPDREDSCPNKGGDGADGCPIPDRDADGVLDPADACPDKPAQTEDGCPPPDRDGDGIPDNVDACPDIPESGADPSDPDAADGCPAMPTDAGASPSDATSPPARNEPAPS